MMKQAYTKHYDSAVDEIVTEAYIFPNFKPGSLPSCKLFSENVAWDTGAEHTLISQDAARALGLESLGKIELRGVGNQKGDLYEIALALPNGKVLLDYQVYGMEIEDYDVVIGMDIISMCDFAITNKDGKCTFSFCMPSSMSIDFMSQEN